MKKSFLILVIGGFLVIGLSEIQAQSTQTESPKAGSEYDALDVWSGNWTIQGEARDSITKPYYNLIWTINGRRILNGYAIEDIQEWHASTYTQKGVELIGYDPVKKTFMCHFIANDGSWVNSTFQFTDKNTCIENGTNYSPNGKSDIGRCKWNFSDDWMTLTVKFETLNDAKWVTLYELKGTKDKKK